MDFRSPQRFIGNDVADAGKTILPQEEWLNHASRPAKHVVKRFSGNVFHIAAKSPEIRIADKILGTAVPDAAEFPRINEAKFPIARKFPNKMSPATSQLALRNDRKASAHTKMNRKYLRLRTRLPRAESRGEFEKEHFAMPRDVEDLSAPHTILYALLSTLYL